MFIHIRLIRKRYLLGRAVESFESRLFCFGVIVARIYSFRLVQPCSASTNRQSSIVVNITQLRRRATRNTRLCSSAPGAGGDGVVFHYAVGVLEGRQEERIHKE